MRAAAEIAAEIKRLEEQRKRVRGGMLANNKLCIDAQICVLRERMDNYKIFDCWPDDDCDCEARMSALDALDWMNGDRDEKPSDGWEPLCR